MRISARAARLTPYAAGEQAPGFIKLNTNENPYPPSPAVEAAVRSYPVERLRLYPSVTAQNLVRAIAKYEGVDDDCVFVGNGSDEVLALAFAALYDGDPVEFPDVTYSFYPVYCGLFDVPYRTVPLQEDFTVDFSAFTGAGGAVIANPNAPTALGVPLEEIARLAGRIGRAVLVDEAYIDFSDRKSAVALIRECDNVAVVKTLSKSYSLAGLRCGYMVACPAIIHAMRSVKDSFNSYPVDSLCETAAAAAVADVTYRDMTVRLVTSTRDRIMGELDKRGVFHTASETNFLFMEGSRELYLAFKDAGILVRHFDTPRLRDYLRVTVGTDADMDAFLKVYDRLTGRDAQSETP